MNETAKEKIAIIRRLLDFLEANDIDISHIHAIGNVFLPDRDALAERIKGLGKLEKFTSDSYFWLRKTFAVDCYVDFNVDRDKVCQRVVTQKVIPARPETVLSALPERVEEVVTWECPESILGMGRDAKADAALASDPTPPADAAADKHIDTRAQRLEEGSGQPETSIVALPNLAERP